MSYSKEVQAWLDGEKETIPSEAFLGLLSEHRALFDACIAAEIQIRMGIELESRPRDELACKKAHEALVSAIRNAL